MPDVAVAIAEEPGTSRKGVAVDHSIHWLGDGRRPWRLFVSLNVLGLMLVAVVLRCTDLANLPGINGDEAWYGVQAELCLRGEPIAWRTPSGNLLNPLFFAPQLAMHAIFAPSFLVLRATAVASGLLALIVNIWLCRRVLGRRIAIISTSILAVLPIDIAYSRLAWDSSQSLLVTLPCIYLPLWAIVDARWKSRCTIWAIAALALAVVVHPTNLFVAPIAMVCLGYAWRAELLTNGRRIRAWCPEKLHRFILVAALGSVVAVGAFAIGSRPAWFGPGLARVANPPQYTAFIANVGRFFSGATVYEYLSGEMSAPSTSTSGDGGFRWDCLPYDIAAWIVGGWLTWGLVRMMRRNRPELVCLAVGWGAGLLGFFLVAGPGALAPNFERYAIWTVGPAAILAAIAIGSWQARSGRAGRLSAILAIAIGWAMLYGFQTNCLGFMRQTGGHSHQTFRTAAVEPKQAALASILAQREPRESVRIVSSEWWIYWPMRYLSLGQRSRDGNVRVSIELQKFANSNAEFRAAADFPHSRSWFVEFTDSPACEAVRQAARDGRMSLRETTIDDFSGRPVLTLFAVANEPAALARESALLPYLRYRLHACAVGSCRRLRCGFPSEFAPRAPEKIKELDLTSRGAELGFLSRNDDQRDRRN